MTSLSFKAYAYAAYMRACYEREPKTPESANRLWAAYLQRNAQAHKADGWRDFIESERDDYRLAMRKLRERRNRK